MMYIRGHAILYRGGPFVASRSTLRDPIWSTKLFYTFPILFWIQSSPCLDSICITMRGKDIKIGRDFFLHKRIDVGTMPGCWVVGFIGGQRHIFGTVYDRPCRSFLLKPLPDLQYESGKFITGKHTRLIWLRKHQFILWTKGIKGNILFSHVFDPLVYPLGIMIVHMVTQSVVNIVLSSRIMDKTCPGSIDCFIVLHPRRRTPDTSYDFNFRINFENPFRKIHIDPSPISRTLPIEILVSDIFNIFDRFGTYVGPDLHPKYGKSKLVDHKVQILLVLVYGYYIISPTDDGSSKSFYFLKLFLTVNFHIYQILRMSLVDQRTK